MISKEHLLKQLDGRPSDGWMSIQSVRSMIESEPDIERQPRGVYECFHCGSYSVVWQSDFSFEDYGFDGEGIVQVCHCQNCGADIEYYIPIDVGEEDAPN